MINNYTDNSIDIDTIMLIIESQDESVAKNSPQKKPFFFEKLSENAP